jgi:hypothetical protein
MCSSCRGLPESFGRKHLQRNFVVKRMIDVAGKEAQDPAGTTVLSCASVVVVQWRLYCCRIELLCSP